MYGYAIDIINYKSVVIRYAFFSSHVLYLVNSHHTAPLVIISLDFLPSVFSSWLRYRVITDQRG